MKKLMQLLGIATLAVAVMVPAMAQDAGPRGGKGQKAEGREGRQMGRMQEVNKKILAQLDLSAEQKEKIKALEEATRAELEKSRPGPDGDRQQARQKMAEIQRNHREKLMAILTPAQRTKYQELWRAEMEKMRKERGGKPGQRPAGAPPAKP